MNIYLYRFVKMYFWHLLNLFYRAIVYLHKEKVPTEGPLIIYANHRNNIVDGMKFMLSQDRPVRVLTAAKLLQKPGVREYLLASGVISAERFEDVKPQSGEGTISQLKESVLTGINTKFSELRKGSTIILKSKRQYKIKEVFSDTQVRISSHIPDQLNINQPYTFKLKPQYQETYDEVEEALKNGECIVIFPEGGSHDLLQMRPFKAGICKMALGVRQKFGIKVKLVPCAVHCYKQHIFRSQFYMEFGQPHDIPEDIVSTYKNDKTSAISQLLDIIQKNLKSMTVNFNSYDHLAPLFLARQLYTLSCEREVSLEQKLELNRRFAKGYMEAQKDEKLSQYFEQLINFSKFLKAKGVSVRSKPTDVKYLRFFILMIRLLFWIALMIPGLILWGIPMSFVAYVTEKERRGLVKRSRVKQYNHHYVGGSKINKNSILLPLTFLINSIIFYFFSSYLRLISKKYQLISSLLLLLFQPFYIHLFVKVQDKIEDDVKEINFLWLYIFKKDSYRYFISEKTRLQKKVCEVVEEFGEKIVQNFQQNRVIKSSQIMMV